MSQMDVDNLRICKNGNLCFYRKEKNNYILMPDFADNEGYSADEMGKRIKKLVEEIIC